MNSKNKSNIFGTLKKQNVKRFSIFIAIAFIFLIFSKLSSDYKQPLKLKVSLDNIEEEIILQQDSSNVIDVLVEAKGFVLLPYIFNNYKTIVIDSKTNMTTKPAHYVFDVQKHKYLIQGQLGSSYTLLSISPDTLILPYSKRASKHIPIVLNTDIEYKTGFDIKGEFRLNVDSVKIVGPEDKIENVNSIATKELKLAKVSGAIDKDIEIDKIKDIEVFPKIINVKADVKRFTEGTIEIPVTITNKPEGITINYFPKTVTVMYYVDLDSYSSISANDFKVECSFNGVDKEQTYFIPKITKSPNFIKRVNIKQKRIDFIKL
ncbi:hypothetical protein [Winogradskyella sp.]|uniref:hypothetical protein n=1 Tax=Winogradskyella sp. TaxID=1883156 RepID=UPI0026174171|nr:hypothetical protein [Winogradskyella sp.]